ncbi:MAG TPA: thioredoxin family protein [Terriglobales bacterium]|nr:thioredoxin family protein [Terriglobales bacterium]
MLAKADLARYAGQFVWLELNYDKPENRAVLTKYGANATPTFFVIDPAKEQVTATQIGAMSLPELEQFLQRGAAGISQNGQTSADAALRRGDALLAPHPAQAAAEYEQALRLAPPSWPRRELAEASYATALENSRQWQKCAETATEEAAHMRRDSMFGRTLVAGMWCMDQGDPEPWSKTVAFKLEPLAREALRLASTERDHRDELYRTLMYLALARNNKSAAADWGDRWLKELDAIRPSNDEERSAVDIARVENIQVYGDPQRVLPALLASERAMPNNYNASLRVAQMEIAAQKYDHAVAACERGLKRAPGASGRSWLLQTKAEALKNAGRSAAARQALEQALEAAQSISTETGRDANINKIKQQLAELSAARQ